ncbi:44187_t:CDS:2 [Gigaspora margarita]|uniref:44187_t:CDS:1 n=1 Tax=Gigaspora margarita TaxID=4874 RepID=A0ABN7UKM8_GIGMA|nr:44187_t:CDS:2 [Gigaspora margarita]
MIPPSQLALRLNCSMASPASPSSPTIMRMKTYAELTASLKEVYNLVKEKDSDLTLAAEIGKSLLENNIALKAKYEELVIEYQQLQRKEQSKATFALQGEKPNAAQIAPPSNSVIESDFEDSDTDLHPITSSFEASPQLQYEKPDKLRNRKKSDNTISYQEEVERTNQLLQSQLDKLVKENQLLQSQLDKLVKENSENDRVNKTKIQKLESDLQHYQEIYSSASHQLEVLEQENERLMQKQKSEF